MNTHPITTLILAGALVALTACEGEPPKVPTNPAPTQPTETGPAISGSAVTPAPAPSGAADTPMATAPGAGHCPCMGGGHDKPNSPEPAADSSAAAAAAPAAVQAPVAGTAAPASGAQSIVGTVTTVPARAAGTAVVYLEDAGIVPSRGALAGVDNHGMSFIPYITVVAAGGRVVFSNSDPFPHNVFSPDNERFNLGTVQMKGSSAHAFKTPGVYSLLCNLHPNMLGFVVVSPSSYFAKANAKGQFTIKDVPPGTYKITAWAPRLPTATQSIVVGGADVTTDFALHR